MKPRRLSLPIMVLLCCCGAGRLDAVDDPTRDVISGVAESAFRAWIEAVPPQGLASFGFRSEEERDRARTLPPIPFVTPRRDSSREQVESELHARPVTWMVPVAVDRRVACLVMVEDPEGEAPRAVELGKTFAANRLDAALRWLGWPPEERWRDLRFLSFVSPNLDLLLIEEPGGSWRWLNLHGTVEPEAVEIEDEEIADLLEIVRRTESPPH